MMNRLELAKKTNSKLSTRQRSTLLKICRSRLYYKPHPRDVSDDVDLMNEIRDIYQKRPYFGYIRMTDEFNGERKKEDRINKKRTYIERFWRTLKYEEVYLKSYDSVRDAKENLAVYIDWYNTQRRHSGIGKKRPIDVLMDNQGDGYVDNSNELPTSPHPQPVLAYLVGCRSLFGAYTSALDRQP